MKYVLFENSNYRCCFPSDMEDGAVEAHYKTIQRLEQHKNSPHRCLSNDFTVACDDIAVDAGSREGNFSLAIIDMARKIYSFEPDNDGQNAYAHVGACIFGMIFWFYGYFNPYNLLILCLSRQRTIKDLLTVVNGSCGII